MIQDKLTIYRFTRWYWSCGPFRSEDGFDTEAEARADADQFLGSFSEEEWREAEADYLQEIAAMEQELYG